MRRSRLGRVAAVAALALVWALVPLSGATALSAVECHDLIADQTVDVGDVCVSQIDGTTIEVVFETVGGWQMTEAHLAVGDIPQTKTGIPIPGQFPYSHLDQAGFTTWTFPVTGLSLQEYKIAAHIKVWDPASQTTVSAVSGTSTMRTDADFNVIAPAALANEPGVTGTYPNCAAQSPSDATMSLWDSNILPKPASFNRFNSAGADWIWDTTEIPLVEAFSGEAHFFAQTLSVPGLPVSGSADVWIAADNAYALSVDGTFLGMDGFGPGFDIATGTGTLMEDPDGNGPLQPQQGQWGVVSQGWQPVDHYSFPVGLGGDFALQVLAANEYQFDGSTSVIDPATGLPIFTGLADHYKSWSPNPAPEGTYSGYNNDPEPNLTNNCTNPGGVIFMAQASYYADSETAWGGYGEEGATNFDGPRWSAYFTYTLTA
ncbi:MAG TPA: hypothetical protein VFT80_02835 [Actinomycetota bacterium]|nr:hypothetical protein [Actinomycetota bacterium]